MKQWPPPQPHATPPTSIQSKQTGSWQIFVHRGLDSGSNTVTAKCVYRQEMCIKTQMVFNWRLKKVTYEHQQAKIQWSKIAQGPPSKR